MTSERTTGVPHEGIPLGRTVRVRVEPTPAVDTTRLASDVESELARVECCYPAPVDAGSDAP